MAAYGKKSSADRSYLTREQDGGISGRFGDGCEVEMLASEENAEVVSDREKEGN